MTTPVSGRRVTVLPPPARSAPPESGLVLGLDPGSRHTGYGVVALGGGRPRALACGRLSPSPDLSLSERLAALVVGLEGLLAAHPVTAAAVERPFHGINARSAIVLAQARGALLATLGRAGIEVREFAPAEVKSAIAASGRAGKPEVARMVGLLLGLDLRHVPPDASDALALALCYAHRQRLDRLSAVPRRGGTRDAARGA